jgi:hypothetical protein
MFWATSGSICRRHRAFTIEDCARVIDARREGMPGLAPIDLVSAPFRTENGTVLTLTDGPLRNGIHASLDMQLPGVIAHESAMQGGAMLDVPEPRVW